MSEQSFVNQAVTKAIIFALMLIPTAISIYIAIQIKDTAQVVPFRGGKTPQIVCFSPDACAIQVQGTWYRISGTIDMEEVIPNEYRLENLINETTVPDNNDELTEN